MNIVKKYGKTKRRTKRKFRVNKKSRKKNINKKSRKNLRRKRKTIKGGMWPPHGASNWEASLSAPAPLAPFPVSPPPPPPQRVRKMVLAEIPPFRGGPNAPPPAQTPAQSHSSLQPPPLHVTKPPVLPLTSDGNRGHLRTPGQWESKEPLTRRSKLSEGHTFIL